MYKPCHHGPLDGMCRWYFIYQMDWYSYVHLPSALELDYAILSYLSQYMYSYDKLCQHLIQATLQGHLYGQCTLFKL